MADLQARVDCLLKENGEHKSQVAAREAQLQEAEALKAVAFEELVRVREDRNKANIISRKFHNFVGHPGDVVNKVRLYDKSVGQSRASLAPKPVSGGLQSEDGEAIEGDSNTPPTGWLATNHSIASHLATNPGTG